MTRDASPGLFLLAFVAAPVPAQATAEPSAPPQSYRALLDCRDTADDRERLACFDAQVAALAAAAAQGDVLVVDRADVERRQRERFGRSERTNPVLAGPDGQPIDSLETTVSAVNYTPLGKLVVQLPDGAVWQQIDSRDLARPPTVGTHVRLRRATLGSYLVNVDGQTAIRMRRTN